MNNNRFLCNFFSLKLRADGGITPSLAAQSSVDGEFVIFFWILEECCLINVTLCFCWLALYVSIHPFFFCFPPRKEHRPLLFLPPSAAVPPPVLSTCVFECVLECVRACVCVYYSLETPISRSCRPPEGHSQSFGVWTEKGWVGQEQLWESWTLSFTLIQ